MAARTPSARAVLVGASAAQAAVSFINFGLPAIGPQLRREYGLSLAGLGAVLTAPVLGAGLALILFGLVVDRIGPRAAMLGGTALATPALVAAAFAPEKELLFLFLLVAGSGTAAVPVAGAASVLRAYPAERRGRAFGIRQTAVPLGGTAAAVLLPVLDSAGGVRLALCVAAGVVCLTGVCFALMVDNEPSSAPVARGFRTVLASPGMARLLLVACFYIAVLQAVVTYTVPSARAAGLSAFAASATFLALNLTAMVARVVWGGAADRGGGARRVRTLVETGVVGAGGAVLFTFALHAGAVAAVLAAIVFGFGALGWNAIVYVTAGERAPPGLAGRSFAVAATVVFVFSAICTPPLGALATYAGWDTFWVATAVISATGAMIATGLPRTLAA